MTENVITKLEQVTIEWLTDVLTVSKALTSGAVASFEVVAGAGNWSTNAQLKLEYTDEAQGALPGQLFFKMVDTNLDDDSFGASEVTYYTRDYTDVPDAPLMKCYSAAYSAEQQHYHLLLDDHSETHTVAADKTPSLEYGLALAEGLAVMHARWWGAGKIAEAGKSMHTEDHIRRFVEIAEPGVGHILEKFTPDLKPHWPEMMHTIFDKHPQAIITRTNDANGFTVIHGDAGARNILVPRNSESPIFIIDRQPFDWSLTIWLGAYDLAYAMVLDWDVETRRELEVPVLKRYHEKLIKCGIDNYPWEQLHDDYRLSVAMGVYIATEYCRGGVGKRWIDVWMLMLKRSLTACDDLNCSELWE